MKLPASVLRSLRHVITIDRGDLIESVVFRISKFEIQAPARAVVNGFDGPLEIVGVGPGRISIEGEVDFVEVTAAQTALIAATHLHLKKQLTKQLRRRR